MGRLLELFVLLAHYREVVFLLQQAHKILTTSLIVQD